MKSIQPKDHPSFKRALGISHGRLMDKHAQSVSAGSARGSGRVQNAADAQEMARIAHQAYTDAVDMLEAECARRARVEYVVDGSTFIDEACRKLSTKPDPFANMVAQALSDCRDTVPGQVRVTLDFGLREDGLLFGSARHEALGGSFQSLQDAALNSLARLLDAPPDSDPPTPPTPLAPPGSAMRQALLNLVAKTLPDDAPASSRPLAAHVEDLRERMSRLHEVDLQADSESRHLLSGAQASARLSQLSEQANQERPYAASASAFLSKLGI